MSKLDHILRTNPLVFGPVVPFDPHSDRLVLLDLSSNNHELTPDIFCDLRLFVAYINEKLASHGARYGIGGYAEYREVYGYSQVFDASKPGEEPRRLHLGIDIWGRPHTVVMAPYDGLVHSFAYNDRPGDYGATILLTHRLDDMVFYTLYGHLSLNSVRNLRTGIRIKKGDKFAEFGIPAENGQWPPHLHFQVIEDLEGWSGDYPGVCRYSEAHRYLATCPDPEAILQLMKSVG